MIQRVCLAAVFLMDDANFLIAVLSGKHHCASVSVIRRSVIDNNDLHQGIVLLE